MSRFLARPFTLYALVASAHAYNLGVPAARGLAQKRAHVRLADDEFAGVKPGTVFMFPGQGAQAVGMGKEAAAAVPAAAELYEKAKGILGYDLLAIDDKAQLDKTDVSQPAHI